MFTGYYLRKIKKLERETVGVDWVLSYSKSRGKWVFDLSKHYTFESDSLLWVLKEAVKYIKKNRRAEMECFSGKISYKMKPPVNN